MKPKKLLIQKKIVFKPTQRSSSQRSITIIPTTAGICIQAN